MSVFGVFLFRIQSKYAKIPTRKDSEYGPFSRNVNYGHSTKTVAFFVLFVAVSRSSHPRVFLGRGALKICSKFTGEHSCQSAISIKSLCNFIEAALRHGCSRVKLLHISKSVFFRVSQKCSWKKCKIYFFIKKAALKKKEKNLINACKLCEIKSINFQENFMNRNSIISVFLVLPIERAH